MSYYAPDKPLRPSLIDMAREYTEASCNIPPSDALQRVHALEIAFTNLAWLVEKLVRERDAALVEKRDAD